MNRTQINWCEKRIKTIRDRKIQELVDSNPELPNLSYGERAEQIVSGKAKLKLDKLYEEDSCPYKMGYVLDMFEWEGEAEIIAKNMEIKSKIALQRKTIERDSEYLFDQFVLGEISEAKALEEFSNKTYRL